MKAPKYLHFEDNEVSILDENEEVVESKKFKTPAKAKAYFDQLMFEFASNEAVRIEFVHYVPQFPPQRLGVWDVSAPAETAEKE